MKPKIAAMGLGISVIGALTWITAPLAQADTAHSQDVQVVSFNDPCHPNDTGTLDLTYRQVQLAPDNQFRQVESGEFSFTPENPASPAATGHFVDQQTVINAVTPGSATLTESIHSVAHYSDGTQNPVQLTTVTTFVDFTAVGTQIVKVVCGS
jgi:hypothetical protein